MRKEEDEIDDKKVFEWTDTTLPPEITQMILEEARGRFPFRPKNMRYNPAYSIWEAAPKEPLEEREGAVTGFVCRRVCKWWRDVVPPQPKPRAQWECFPCVVARMGNLSLLRWAYVNGCSMDLKHILPYAARAGNIKMLKWLVGQKRAEDGDKMFWRAAKGGHKHVFDWAIHQQGMQVENLDKCILKACKGRGGPALLRYLLDILTAEKDYSRPNWRFFNKWVQAAMSAGRKDLIEILLPLLGSDRQTFSAWGGMCCLAAASGNIEMMEWLRSQGMTPGDDSDDGEGCLAAAADTGHLDMVKWLRGIGCIWDNRTAGIAAVRGHWEVMKYALNEGCPIDMEDSWLPRCVVTFQESKRVSDVKQMLLTAKQFGCIWETNDVMVTAAKWGSPELLEFLHSTTGGVGCKDAIATAAERTSDRHREWIPRRPFPDAFWYSAITAGALESVRWGVAKGWPLAEICFQAAAEIGSIEIMEWLHDKGCPWDKDACLAAAGDGRLEALQWLKEKGCPWSIRGLKEAMQLWPSISNWVRQYLTDHPEWHSSEDSSDNSDDDIRQ